MRFKYTKTQMFVVKVVTKYFHSIYIVRLYLCVCVLAVERYDKRLDYYMIEKNSKLNKISILNLSKLKYH